MADRRIRVVARGLVRRGDELLVAREYGPAADDPFYVPLGGGVEFGEHSAEALRREFREELDVELENVSYLETYEDVFVDEGRQRHEIWRVYEADVAEDWPYERDEFTAHEPDGEEIECVWKPVAELGPEDGDVDTFYPERLLDRY